MDFGYASLEKQIVCIYPSISMYPEFKGEKNW